MIADILHKIAEQEQASKGQTGFGPYRPRPSGAGPERCVRSMVYHAMGMPPKPLPGRSLFVFEDGGWHEELTLNWLEKNFILKPQSRQAPITLKGVLDWMPHNPRKCSVRDCKEVIFDDDIHGHIDFEVTDLEKVVWLVEHKALNHFTFNRLWDAEHWPLDYLTQMGIYMRALNRKKGLLLIKNKNTAQYIEFHVDYDHDTDTIKIIKAIRSDGDFYDVDFAFANVVKNAIDKFRLVDEYLKKKELPARPYAYGTDFPCGYCSWEGSCWLGYEEEITAMAVGTVRDQTLYDLCNKERELQREQSELSSQIKLIEAKRKEGKLKIRNCMMEKQVNQASVAPGATADGTLPPVFDVSIKMVHKAAQAPTEYEQTTVKDIAYGRKEDTANRRETRRKTNEPNTETRAA